MPLAAHHTPAPACPRVVAASRVEDSPWCARVFRRAAGSWTTPDIAPCHATALRRSSRRTAAGARGVIMPLIESRADAERFVSACLHYPQGTRSWGPLRAELMHRLEEEGRFDSYANAGTRVNNYIRARIVNAALGLEEEKPDGQWLEEAVDEATDEDLVHMICEYLDSRPERKVGLAPSGNGIEARVGETQWDDSGHFGHASLRVVGWDFVSFDFKDQLRLDRELAQKIAPNLKGAIILEPRQCLSIHIQVAVILLRLRKKGEVPPVHELHARRVEARPERPRRPYCVGR